MAERAKEWICFLLFRFLLPLSLIAATIFRFSGFSLLYGCFALINPLIPRPTHSSLSSHTGRYLVSSVIIFSLTFLAQVVFQTYVAVTESERALNNSSSSWLENCTVLESTLRQIGLQKIRPDDVLNSARIVLPDVVSLVVSVLVLVVCRLLLRRTTPETAAESLPDDSTSGETTVRKRLFRFGVVVAEFLGNFLVIAFTGLCGIATPSVLNSVYFVGFLVVATLWSCGVRLGFWFCVYRVAILVYVAAHLIAIYLNQFEFMQIAWADAFKNDTLVERILGLDQFVVVDCDEPWILHVADGVRWTEFFNVAALLSFYFLVAIEVRRGIDTSSSRAEFAPLSTDDTAVMITQREEEEGGGGGGGANQLIDIASQSSEAQGLIEGQQGLKRRYHSMDDNNGRGLDPEHPVSPSGDLAAPSVECRRRSTQFDTTKYVTNMIVELAMQQSYVATLVIMMVWSVTYPSWLAFVFLIWACVIWMIPKKRILCLRCSPLIVFYAECLLTIQYIYGFDLTDSELPSKSSGQYNLRDIGLVKYAYPVGPLAAQAAFTCVFWFTLYQFVWETSSNSRRLSHVDSSSLETLEGEGEREGEGDGERRRTGHGTSRRRKRLLIVKSISEKLWNMLCKYWIIVCGLLFLLMALQEAVIFRMVYMVLFLYFIITFQVNYTFWRFCVKGFWSVVIIYSMFVLVAIYVFQFEFIVEKWLNFTHMSSDLLDDIGFRRYNTASLFVELLTPTSFLIFIILHLHYFQKTFLALSDINRFKNEDAFSNRNNDEDDQERLQSTAASRQKSSDDSDQSELIIIWNSLSSYFKRFFIIVWRLLEVHIHKLILMTIFLVSVNDVCAANVVFVFLMVIFIPLGFKRLMSLTSMIYASCIILVRMAYQLNLMKDERTYTNCTELRNLNTSGHELPAPFNETVHSALYIGLRKEDSMSSYVKDYMIIVLLLTLESIIIIHQKQFYNHPQNPPLPIGIIFPRIDRAQADISLTHCAMFLVNYGFYKFGKEICFIMTIVTMVVRLDVFSVVYGVFLGILLLLGRQKCRLLWPIYIILLAFLLVVQYLSCVGVPVGLCWQYPWQLSPSDFTNNLGVFLFLPNFVQPPDATNLVVDFFQLLFVCLQWKVFLEEKKPSAETEGGFNRSVAGDIAKKKCNPTDDFVSYKDSYLDYVKIGVFYYSFWVTLLILFITGTVRISVFCLGYLVACFFFLWFGQDLLRKPLRTVRRMWTALMMFSFFVILTKCCLQLYGCVYSDKAICPVFQLFNIICLRQSFYRTSPNVKDCSLTEDMAGMAWDAVSFVFVLILIRIYKTWYFQHIVTELEIDNALATRGSQIINMKLFHQIEERKLYEENMLDRIRTKMERIKMRQYRLNPKSAASSDQHYVVIRSGDYCMFEDLSDDDLELQTEISDETILEEITKKPGPLQIINAGLQGGTKMALDMWDRPSTSSPQSMIGSQTVSPTTIAAQIDQQAAAAADAADKTSGDGSIQLEEDRDRNPEADDKDDVFAEAEKDECKADGQADAETEPLCIRITHLLKLSIVVFCAFVEKLILFLNDLSKDYNEVSCILKEEKDRMKQKRRCDTGVDRGYSPLIGGADTNSSEPQLSDRPSEITLHVEDLNNRLSRNDFEEQKQAERKFHRQMPLLFRLIVAAFAVVMSHSDLLCYFAMVLNVLMSGSVVSLVYPIITFLWAFLSTPRPSKAFWVFVITYTEVLIVIKYIFQFAFMPWNTPLELDKIKNHVFAPIYVLGMEKKDTYAVFDILLLFCLFLHRSVLKTHGLWKGQRDSATDLENAELASRHATPAASPTDPKRRIDFGASGDGDATASSADLTTTRDNPALDGSMENDGGGGDATVVRFITADPDVVVAETSEPDGDDNCCSRLFVKPLVLFYKRMTNPRFSAADDIYAFMFLCDLVTFIIVIFGYSSFGPSSSLDSGSNSILNVTSVIKQNKIPAPFLAMMLAQFILIIIDRAIYLRKRVLMKLIFQILLVVLVHAWMFFGLPQLTQRRFVDNVAAQLWYFTKCIYFALSSYQIRCGYPTRILGNFLTKKYNYLNLYSFQVFLAIPFLLELRAMMDWMFTDTTLALGSWLQMEDIYSNIFCIKCNRRAEKTYPVKRGEKRPALVKYGLGGVILFILIFIIWFPLLLFSMSEAIYEPNRPVAVEIKMQIYGYEPMFTMTAQKEDLTVFSQRDYDDLSKKLNARAQTFLSVYRKEDIYACKILGISAATWGITPPYVDRLRSHLLKQTNTSIYFSISFTREPSPSLQSATITGQFERLLTNKTDGSILTGLANMLIDSEGSNQTVTIDNIFPNYVSVPAGGKPSTVDYLMMPSPNQGLLSGNLSLQLSTTQTGTKWWTINEINSRGVKSESLQIISFNDRIAPPGVLSLISSYGVIGLYVSLVLVIGRFVRMWIQGQSFKIMFIELPNPDVLLKLCLDIYMVRETGELELEEDLFAQLIFLYRSPETLIKVTKYKMD